MERELHLPPHKFIDIKELGFSHDDDELVARLHRYQEQHSPLGAVWGVEATSALAANMPGIMSLAEVQSEIPLGRWRIKLGNRGVFHLDVSATPSLDRSARAAFGLTNL